MISALFFWMHTLFDNIHQQSAIMNHISIKKKAGLALVVLTQSILLSKGHKKWAIPALSSSKRHAEIGTEQGLESEWQGLNLCVEQIIQW